MKKENLRICIKECKIPHYENCLECFEFGKMHDGIKDNWKVLYVGEIIDILDFIKQERPAFALFSPCDFCNSIIIGPPS